MTDTTLAARWANLPDRLTTNQYQGEGAIYTIGAYDVTVRYDQGHEPALTATHRYRRGHDSDPRRTLPNLSVDDGELRFPIEDLIPLVLARLTPAELAESLWVNDEVRAAFLSAATNRWAAAFTDADRRALLAGLREAVHNEALEKAKGFLGDIEHQVAHRFYYYDAVRRLREMLRGSGNLDEDGLFMGADGLRRPLPFAPYAAPELEIGPIGATTVWSEARDAWRARLTTLFPPPAPAMVADALDAIP